MLHNELHVLLPMVRLIDVLLHLLFDPLFAGLLCPLSESNLNSLNKHGMVNSSQIKSRLSHSIEYEGIGRKIQKLGDHFDVATPNCEH